MLVRRRALLHSGVVAGLLAPTWLWSTPAEAARGTVHHHHRSVARHHRASHPARPLVMIDPGHGGKDPGCIGVTGTLEKHVVLAVGLELRRHLLATGTYRVMMTRQRDIFIPLTERVMMARRHGAALLVSLHANSSPHPAVCGACVYRFAYTASDAHAAAVARMENDADRLGGAGLPHVSHAITRILASLMHKETIGHSTKLQHCIVNGLNDHVSLLHGAARHARFVVLSAPDVASVLVETGFLSNRAEEALLRKRAHRLVLARSLRTSIDAYFVASRHFPFGPA